MPRGVMWVTCHERGDGHRERVQGTGPADWEAQGMQLAGGEQGGGDEKEGPKRSGADNRDLGARRNQQKANGREGRAGNEDGSSAVKIKERQK